MNDQLVPAAPGWWYQETLTNNAPIPVLFWKLVPGPAVHGFILEKGTGRLKEIASDSEYFQGFFFAGPIPERRQRGQL